MATVQFEDENNQAHYTSRSVLGAPVQPKMVSSLLKMGVIKDEKQAGFVLIGIAVAALALSAYLIFSFVLPPEAPADVPDVFSDMPV